jgi:hypothetical protein
VILPDQGINIEREGNLVSCYRPNPNLRLKAMQAASGGVPGELRLPYRLAVSSGMLDYLPKDNFFADPRETDTELSQKQVVANM